MLPSLVVLELEVVYQRILVILGQIAEVVYTRECFLQEFMSFILVQRDILLHAIKKLPVLLHDIIEVFVVN
jgi:hypothetical protein